MKLREDLACVSPRLEAKYSKRPLGRESINAKPLLVKVVDEGKVIYKTPSLISIRKDLKNNISRFPKRILELYPRYRYPVVLSRKLLSLRQALAAKLKERQ